MLMPIISDSYRGVKVSVGFATQSGCDIYFRMEFVGSTWNQILDNPAVDGKMLANMLYLGGATYKYAKDETSGFRTFIWFANVADLGENISLFTILGDIFNRIDVISPFPRGVCLNIGLKERFKKFLSEYAFNDSKKVYTNGSDLVQMFRVLDALDMIETGLFEYVDGATVANPVAHPATDSDVKDDGDAVKAVKPKKNNKKVSKKESK